jgi:phage gp36-like protein
MALYAAAADMVSRFDEREIQHLVVDDNSTDYSAVDVTSNIRVDIALDDAEGEVVAALRKGGRYNAATLAALSGTDEAYLKRMICEIAFLNLLRRRPQFNPETLAAYESLRRRYLTELQNGSSIITDDEPTDNAAGRISNEGPTVVEWKELNLWRDTAKYFPRRRP